jgi:hypothetical protein
VLPSVFSNVSRSQARDRVDTVAQQAGWQVPDWYLELKAVAVILASAPRWAPRRIPPGSPTLWSRTGRSTWASPSPNSSSAIVSANPATFLSRAAELSVDERLRATRLLAAADAELTVA